MLPQASVAQVGIHQHQPKEQSDGCWIDLPQKVQAGIVLLRPSLVTELAQTARHRGKDQGNTWSAQGKMLRPHEKGPGHLRGSNVSTC